MRLAELNWMQVERYLERDDRIVLPLGCTEQHAYLSLATDSILAERVSAEAAEPLGVPVLPVLPFSVTPGFVAFPGSVSLRLETLVTVICEAFDSLYEQGFRRFVVVNGHGPNSRAEKPLNTWAERRAGAQLRFHSWFLGERTLALARSIHPDPSHANWFESFPWTRLPGVEAPSREKPGVSVDECGDPQEVRRSLGDGSFGGPYARPDEEMHALWQTAIDEVRELL